MGKLALQVKEGRARRNAARAAFDAHLTQVKQDLEARSVGGRIADKIEREARDTLEEALEIAGESKGVAVGTAAALALWYLRNPILAWFGGLFVDADEDGDEEQAAESENAAPSPEGIEPFEAQDEDFGDVTNY